MGCMSRIYELPGGIFLNGHVIVEEETLVFTCCVMGLGKDSPLSICFLTFNEAVKRTKL